jgi:thioredoxin-like negative regulator of GroEL
MALKNMSDALKCFSQTVSIDESNGEAWGNMASCYIALKKINEAYMTLEQAVKYC